VIKVSKVTRSEARRAHERAEQLRQRKLSELEEYSTPATTHVYNNPLAEFEEIEEDMPTLPDPPKYRGESSKDDLPALLHEFGMWERKVRSSASSITTETVLDLAANAFPYRSQALEWYELNKDITLTQTRANIPSNENACRSFTQAKRRSQGRYN
jgi:hypothetical protein